MEPPQIIQEIRGRLFLFFDYIMCKTGVLAGGNAVDELNLIMEFLDSYLAFCCRFISEFSHSCYVFPLHLALIYQICFIVLSRRSQ